VSATLITGATGFVGACLARRLLAEGRDVNVLVRPEHRTWRINAIRDAVRLHEVSLEDQAALARTLQAIRPESVFHLAAYGAYASQVDLQRMVRTNVLGTMNLVRASLDAGVTMFVNTGTSSEYGPKDHAPGESEVLEPNSHYAVTKAAATLFCRHTARTSQMRIPTLRLYSVFGPYEEPSRLVPALILRGLRGGFPPLVRGDIARDYVYVEDVVAAYLLAAKKVELEPGSIFNIGTGVQTSLTEIVELVRSALGVKAVAKWGSMPPRAWDTSVWVADSTQARRLLGWSPHFTLAEGLRSFIDWLKGQPDLLALYYRLVDVPVS
jgi:nucleoside-diphosphate-sugar epimerase